jgi:hypothetical protein
VKPHARGGRRRKRVSDIRGQELPSNGPSGPRPVPHCRSSVVSFLFILEFCPKEVRSPEPQERAPMTAADRIPHTVIVRLVGPITHGVGSRNRASTGTQGAGASEVRPARLAVGGGESGAKSTEGVRPRGWLSAGSTAPRATRESKRSKSTLAKGRRVGGRPDVMPAQHVPNRVPTRQI